MFQQDAEVGPILAGVALVSRTVYCKAFKPAVTFDVSRDVLIAADRLGIPHLQDILNVILPIVGVPRLCVTRHMVSGGLRSIAHLFNGRPFCRSHLFAIMCRVPSNSILDCPQRL
jgi:hypothetical protein